MQTDLYEFERHPLQGVIESCNAAIASYRKSLFIGGAFTCFNVGIVCIRALELWAEMPWGWFPAGATVVILLMHLLSLVVMALTWRWSYSRRQRWINLRQSCRNAMKAQSHIAIDFHLDQIGAAFQHLRKL